MANREAEPVCVHPMLPTILCVALSRQHALQIVERLESAKVPSADISVMFYGTGQEQAESAAQPTADSGKADVPAQAQTGAAAGAAVAAASLTVPGLQPLLVTAPLAAAFGAVVGAIVGAANAMSELESLGITEAERGVYRQKLDAGGHLVAVRTEDEDELVRAQAVFEQSGGQNIALFRLTKRLT